MRPRLVLPATVALLMAGCGAVFVNQGSKDPSLADGLAPPRVVKPDLKLTRAQRIIGDFEDGTQNLNPQLYGNPGGGWIALTWGGNSLKGDFAAAGGAAGTAKAAHIYGTLTDRGDSQYPAFTLAVAFKRGGLYDASPFSGIRFHYKCPPLDEAPKRRFAVLTAPTVPPSSGGTCARGCWNHYGADLDPSSEWALKSYAFSELKREAYWGSPVMPPDLPDHLMEFLALQWAHSSTNIPASFQIDYWVDEVEFY